jgi:hypothetical protein
MLAVQNQWNQPGKTPELVRQADRKRRAAK